MATENPVHKWKNGRFMTLIGTCVETDKNITIVDNIGMKWYINKNNRTIIDNKFLGIDIVVTVTSKKAKFTKEYQTGSIERSKTVYYLHSIRYKNNII